MIRTAFLAVIDGCLSLLKDDPRTARIGNTAVTDGHGIRPLRVAIRCPEIISQGACLSTIDNLGYLVLPKWESIPLLKLELYRRD